MVDLSFTSRAEHFVPLALLRHFADQSSSEPPSGVEYIEGNGVKAIKGLHISWPDSTQSINVLLTAMDLVTRGRLSVQRVDEKAWDAITLLAERGGWEEWNLKPNKKGGAAPKPKATTSKKSEPKPKPKRKTEEESDDEAPPPKRRSTRSKT